MYDILGRLTCLKEEQLVYFTNRLHMAREERLEGVCEVSDPLSHPQVGGHVKESQREDTSQMALGVSVPSLSFIQNIVLRAGRLCLARTSS